MNADGSNVTRLTGPDPSIRNPVWSSDGQWIAFTSSRDGHSAEVYLVKADGTSVSPRLTANPDGLDRVMVWIAQ